MTLLTVSMMVGTCVQRWNSSSPRLMLSFLPRSQNHSRVLTKWSIRSISSSSSSLSNDHHFYHASSAIAINTALTTRWMSDDHKPYATNNTSSDAVDVDGNNIIPSAPQVPPLPPSPPTPISPPPSSFRPPPRNSTSIGSFQSGAIMTGTVKFYLREKGYGFILADGRPDKDLFVHRGGIVCTHQLSEMVLNATPKYPYLKQNERVRFVLSNDMGAVKAVNVTWLNGDPIPPERKNYLGGVYERSHRLFGEACMNVMKQKADTIVPFTEEEYERIRIAYIENIRSIEHAERIIIELGMDVSQFPTIKGTNSTRGRYLFQHEVDEENKKAIENAIAAANNSKFNTNNNKTQQSSSALIDGSKSDPANNSVSTSNNNSSISSLFDQEVISESSEDDMYSDSAPDKH